MTHQLFLDTIAIVKELAGNGIIYFDSAIEVKLTPHTPQVFVWAVCVSPEEELYVMDANEAWYPLAITDVGANLMIGSLYQRLKLMPFRYAKAS